MGKQHLLSVFLRTPPVGISCWKTTGNSHTHGGSPSKTHQECKDTAFSTGWDAWTPLRPSPPAAHGREAMQSRRLMMSLQSTD